MPLDTHRTSETHEDTQWIMEIGESMDRISKLMKAWDETRAFRSEEIRERWRNTKRIQPEIEKLIWLLDMRVNSFDQSNIDMGGLEPLLSEYERTIEEDTSIDWNGRARHTLGLVVPPYEKLRSKIRSFWDGKGNPDVLFGELFALLLEWNDTLLAREERKNTLGAMQKGVQKTVSDIVIHASEKWDKKHEWSASPMEEENEIVSALSADLENLTGKFFKVETHSSTLKSDTFKDFEKNMTYLKKNMKDVMNFLAEIEENMNLMRWLIPWDLYNIFLEKKDKILTWISATEHECLILDDAKICYDILTEKSLRFEGYETWEIPFTFIQDREVFMRTSERVLNYIPREVYTRQENEDKNGREKRAYTIIPDEILPFFSELWAIIRKVLKNLRHDKFPENPNIGIIDTAMNDVAFEVGKWEDSSHTSIEPIAPSETDEEKKWGENVWWNYINATETSSVETWLSSSRIRPEEWSIALVSRRSQRPMEKDPTILRDRILFYSLRSLLDYLDMGEVHTLEKMVDATLKAWKWRWEISQDAIILLHMSKKNKSVRDFLLYIFSDRKYVKPVPSKNKWGWIVYEENEYWDINGTNPNIDALEMQDPWFDIWEYKMNMREKWWKKVSREWERKNSENSDILWNNLDTGDGHTPPTMKADEFWNVSHPQVEEWIPDRVASSEDPTWSWNDHLLEWNTQISGDDTNTPDIQPMKQSYEIFPTLQDTGTNVSTSVNFLGRSETEDRISYYNGLDIVRDLQNRNTKRLEEYIQLTFQNGRWRQTQTDDYTALAQRWKSEKEIGLFLSAMSHSPLYEKPEWVKKGWFKRLFEWKNKTPKNNYWDDKNGNANLEDFFLSFRSSENTADPVITPKEYFTREREKWDDTIEKATLRNTDLSTSSSQIINPFATLSPEEMDIFRNGKRIKPENWVQSIFERDITHEGIRKDIFLHCPQDQSLVQFVMRAIDYTLLNGVWNKSITEDMSILMSTANPLVCIARRKMQYSQYYEKQYRRNGVNANLDLFFQEAWAKKRESNAIAWWDEV